MSESKSNQPSQEELDARSRQRWIDRGFDPDQRITEYFDCFTLEEAKNSLFNTTYTQPVPVYLTDEKTPARIPIVIYLATPIYVRSESGIGYEDYPDWYFEAWVMNPGISPEQAQALRRVRIWVCTLGTGEFGEDDMFEWQEIAEDDPGARRIKNWPSPK